MEHRVETCQKMLVENRVIHIQFHRDGSHAVQREMEDGRYILPRNSSGKI